MSATQSHGHTQTSRLSTTALLLKSLTWTSCFVTTPASPSVCRSHHDYLLCVWLWIFSPLTALSAAPPHPPVCPSPPALLFHTLPPYPPKVPWPIILVTPLHPQAIPHHAGSILTWHVPSFLSLFLHPRQLFGGSYAKRRGYKLKLLPIIFSG